MVEWVDAEMFKGWSQEQLKTIFDDALSNLRNDEAVYVVAPPGTKIVPYGSSSKAYDVRAIIRDKQGEILMRFFAQFLKLGMDNGGTQALVKGSQEFFSLALQGLQQVMLETWNQQLVPFVFRFNSFPGMTALPVITWNNPGKVDILALLESYSKGVGARVLTPNEADEDHVRAVMDLPDRPAGVGEEPRDPVGVIPTGFPGFGG